MVAVKKDVAKSDFRLLPLPKAPERIDTTCGVCLEDPRGVELGERPLRTFCCGKHICEPCAKEFAAKNPALAAICPYCRSSAIPDTQFDVFLRALDDVWHKGDPHAAYILGCGFHPLEPMPFHDGHLATSRRYSKNFLNLSAGLGHRSAIQALTQYSWLSSFDDDNPSSMSSSMKHHAVDIYNALLADPDIDLRTRSYASKQLNMILSGYQGDD